MNQTNDNLGSPGKDEGAILGHSPTDRDAGFVVARVVATPSSKWVVLRIQPLQVWDPDERGCIRKTAVMIQTPWKRMGHN